MSPKELYEYLKIHHPKAAEGYRTNWKSQTAREDKRGKTLAETLQLSFWWGKTPEGHSYWWNIFITLPGYSKEPLIRKGAGLIVGTKEDPLKHTNELALSLLIKEITRDL